VAAFGRSKIHPQRALALLALALVSCVSPGRYTSLDLAVLPCELGEAPDFFLPIEFTADGTYLYPQQKDTVLADLRRGEFADLIFFLHGWNKSPASAELDYQNFICRFHGKLDASLQNLKRQGKLRVIGVFWPSTITNRQQEPWLLKPLSYFKIRKRVDRIAVDGFAPLLGEIGEVIIDLERSGDPATAPRRLHLIGHSFGGRMIIRSFQKLSDEDRLIPILQVLDATNVTLINAAAPPTFFDWIDPSVASAWKLGLRGRFAPESSSYLLNLHSQQDSANRILFRIASIFSPDPVSCAVGACGIPNRPTLCVDTSGKVIEPPQVDAAAPDLNVRNIDTTSVVYSHTDIYKGRMATLIADLLYGKATREILRRPAPIDAQCQ
jgi:hypothetical protein